MSLGFYSRMNGEPMEGVSRDMPWSDQNFNRITLASRLRTDLEDKEQGKQLRKDGALE